MKIAIAKAYNGVHRKLRREFCGSGEEVKLFDIDRAGWSERARRINADAFVWFADDKHAEYRSILDRLYFLENYLGVRCFPDLNMYYAFNDKIKQYYILSWLKAPRLWTYITFNKERALAKIDSIDYPVVLKDAHSFGGKGVFKIDEAREMRKAVEKVFSGVQGYGGIKDHIFLQRFVPDLARDLRVITLGDKVVSAYWRVAPAGKWKHNLQQGGGVSYEDIPRRALEICLDISRKMGFHWMSYDCFLESGKIYINEFSCNFGVKGATLEGRDIRKEQAEYIRSRLREKL